MPRTWLNPERIVRGFEFTVAWRGCMGVEPTLPACFEGFFNYNVDVLGGTRISDRAWQTSFTRGRLLTARDLRLCRHLADRLPRRPAEDRRSCARPARHGGSHPSVRGDWGKASGADRRLHPRPG